MVKAHIELLGTDTGDSNRSALLFFDDHRYLFECGDGTQRICTEYGVSIATDKLRKVFVSRMDPSSIGGLLGLALTVADSGKSSLGFVGPEGLERLFNESKPFFYRPKMQLNISEVTITDSNKPALMCNEPNVIIEAIPGTCSRGGDDERGPGVNMEDRTGEPHRKRSRGQIALNFACLVKDLPGKFDPKKATALGIPRGPLFGKLTKGENITLADGSIVQPNQVMSMPTPGPLVLIISCPCVNYVQSVTSTQRLSPGYLMAGRDRDVCIIHFSPLEVLHSESYRVWTSGFGAKVTHIVVDAAVTSMRPIFRGQADAITRANVALGDTFAPLPYGFEAKDSDLRATDQSHGLSGTVTAGATLLRFCVAPASAVGLDRSQVPEQVVNLSSILQEVGRTAVSQVQKELLLSQDSLSCDTIPACLEGITGEAAEVRFLGTAAAVPGKHRNVSSIFLNLFNRGGALLDCGEGTYGQLVRCLGRQKAESTIASLLFVWISHLHADHHLGLLQVLSKRAALQTERPLMVIGPTRLRQWLSAYRDITGGELSFVFIDNSELMEPQEPTIAYFEENFGVKLRCCEVDHCPQAYGLTVEDCIRHWKLCYSGDTRPSEELVRIGRNSTLLIHEATLEDGMEQEAHLKAHSTVGQALDISARMGAYRVVLTHFSQRYPRVPVINAADPKAARAAVAFDFLTINFNKLKSLPTTLPLLLALYPNEAPSDEKDGVM